MPSPEPGQNLKLPPRPSLVKRGCASIVVDIKTTTPILGGGVETRKVDDTDVLRPASIRGHLRFWWRALEGHRFETAAELYKEEARLWGCAGGETGGGRSPVEISVEISNRTLKDTQNVTFRDEAFYALWPAQEQNTPDRPAVRAAERYPHNVGARLTFTCHDGHREMVERVLRAWILFGGVGGRTRRGVGSLTCSNVGWLPEMQSVRMPNEDDYDPNAFADREARVVGASTQALALALNHLLGENYFRGGTVCRPRPFPLLSGARLIVGTKRQGDKLGPFQKAEEAWHTALHWLRDFRQQPGFARSGPSWRNPGRSNWPEADKLRLLMGAPARRHPPRPAHAAMPAAWPRAGFGLPIVGRFKDLDDPGPFTINWAGADGKVRERMASPLIVKPLAVKGGYLACALWLTRDDQPGQVGVVDPHNKERLLARLQASFGATVGPTGTPLLPGFASDVSLRDAFLDWVARKPDVWSVP